MGKKTPTFIDELSGISAEEAQGLIHREVPGSRVSPVLVSRRGRRVPVEVARWGAWGDQGALGSVHRKRSGALKYLASGPRSIAKPYTPPKTTAGSRKRIVTYGLLPAQFNRLQSKLKDLQGLDLRNIPSNVRITSTDFSKVADLVLTNRFMSHAADDIIKRSGVKYAHLRSGGLSSVESAIREAMGQKPKLPRGKGSKGGKKLLSFLAAAALPAIVERLNG